MACFVLLCSGCTTLRSYDQEIREPLSLAGSGQFDAAVHALERRNRSARSKDLLYHMELGELQRLGHRYAASNAAWSTANRQVQDWEARAKLDPARSAGAILSYTVNDKLRPYEGEDYEKVMLTIRTALNHLAEGNWEDARVAIKQTHEREAVIAQVRSKEYEQVEEQARRKGARTSVKDLNGYPVDTIDTAEVNALRNGYQSAFGHYLAGFVYEALGEPGLAAAGYRQAIELRPDAPLLEDALAGLDERLAGSDDGKCDLLIAIETGMVPARVSQQFPLPVPVRDRLVLIPVSFPVLRDTDPGIPPFGLRIDGEVRAPTALTSIDAMARRALKDEMPGIMVRGFVRSAAKAAAQYEAQRQADSRRRRRDEGAAALFDVAGIALALGAVVTESADERSWRSLPATIWSVRAKLGRGLHRIEVPTAGGLRSTEVEARGRHTFVHLRVMGDRLFNMAQPPATPSADPLARRMHAGGLPRPIRMSNRSSG